MDPHPLTLRELCMMADSRSRAEWRRASWVLALLANVREALLVNPRREPWMGDDFFPFPRETSSDTLRKPSRRTVTPDAFLARFTREERVARPARDKEE